MALLQQWRPPERIMRTYPIALPESITSVCPPGRPEAVRQKQMNNAQVIFTHRSG